MMIVLIRFDVDFMLFIAVEIQISLQIEAIFTIAIGLNHLTIGVIVKVRKDSDLAVIQIIMVVFGLISIA